jgi:6-phosphogluconolactonase
MRVQVYQTDSEAFEAAANLVVTQLQAALARGRARFALTGGHSGRALLTLLAKRRDVPWDRIDYTLTDDRWVPGDDPDSNLRLARELLFEPCGVPTDRIHPPPTDRETPDATAAAWARDLVAFAGDPPVLDVVVLALAPDGHIASLMPGSAALRSTAWTAGVSADEVGVEPRVARVSLTAPVLTAAGHVVMTAVGGERAAALRAAIEEPVDTTRRPSQLLLPSARCTWIADRAAAAQLGAQ